MYGLIGKIIGADGKLLHNRITLDFSSLRFIEPTGVTVLSNLIEFIKYNGGRVEISGHSRSEDAIAYLDDSQFFKQYDGKSIFAHATPRATTSPLELVKHSGSLFWIENRLVPWISERTGIRRSALSTVNVCFQEIFNNIRDHSSIDIGCIFGQHYPQNNTVQISISDFGIGIPENVKKIRPELSDRDCLELATNEGFTTKTGRNNRGAGLDILTKYLVQHNKGFLRIHSKNGALACLNEGGAVKKVARTAAGFYPGTLIQATFRTDTIDTFDDDDEEFQWSS